MFSYFFTQNGGGNCSICGSTGVTKTTCPCNPLAKNPDHVKHPKAKTCVKTKKIVKKKIVKTKTLNKAIIKKPEKLIRLNGANLFAKLVNDDKIIYLIGESHNYENLCKVCTKPDCITVEEFIIDQIQSSETIVDVFYEIVYHKGTLNANNIPRSSPMFKSATTTFLNCLQEIKQSCPYENARFHYSDARLRKPGEIDIFTYLMLGLKNKKKIKQSLLQKLEEIEDFEPIILDFFTNLISGENVGESDLYKFLRIPVPISTRISKQLNQLPIDTRQKLLQVFINKYNEYVPPLFTKIGWSNMLKVLNNNQNIEEHKVNRYYMSTMFLFLSASIMDIYLLARLLKPSLDTSKTKIIYTGSAHSRNYINYLMELGWDVTFFKSSLKETSKCLNIPYNKETFPKR